MSATEGDRWECWRLANGEVHVKPIGDLIAHEPEDCPCGPRTEAVPREDGSMGWLVVHDALDGRELAERGAAVPRELP